MKIPKLRTYEDRGKGKRGEKTGRMKYEEFRFRIIGKEFAGSSPVSNAI